MIFLSIFRVSLFARGRSSELLFLMSVTSNAFEIHRRVSSLTLLRSPSASVYWSDPAIYWTVPTCVVAVFRPYFSPSLSGKGRHVFCSLRFVSGKKKSKSSGSRRGNVGRLKSRPQDSYPAEDDYFEHGHPAPRDVPFRAFSWFFV